MEKHNTKWSQDEIKFLNENYPIHGKNYCSMHLKRTPRAIFAQAQKLKLYINASVKRKSSIKYTFEDIQNAVNKSYCYSDVIRNLGIIPQAGNFENIKNRIIEYGININHFLTPGELTKNRLKNGVKNAFQLKSLEEILTISNLRIDNRRLKKRLFDAGLKNNICELCGVGENWNGGILSLRLDHINGNNKDYRLENLRIICPNCDSTLETYCSKNRIKVIKEKKNVLPIIKKCIICEKEFETIFHSKQQYCSRKCRRKTEKKKDYTHKCNLCNKEFNSKKNVQKYCSINCSSESQRKFNRPTYIELLNDINLLSNKAIGRKYNVKDTTIKKWIKQYEKQASVGERSNSENS